MKDLTEKGIISLPLQGGRKNREPTRQETNIGGIPACIVREHNEVFPSWWRSGLIKAVLIHVDEHSDMLDSRDADVCPSFPEDAIYGSVGDYGMRLNIANFILPAVHLGIVDRVYWVKPNENEVRCFNRVEARPPKGIMYQSFITRDSGGKIKWLRFPDYTSVPMSQFPDEYNSELDPLLRRLPELSEEIRRNLGNNPIILDIDLDAFRCSQPNPNSPLDVVGDEDYKGKIVRTIEMLRQLPKPRLISIARSPIFVPPQEVNAIQQELMSQLGGIY